MSIPKNFHDYRTFTHFIASDPELLIFRRFGHINIRNILYLQSELLALEARLKEYDEQDIADGTMDTMLSMKCWETLEARAAEDRPREAVRMKLIREIEVVTRRYNKALILQSQVLRIGKPEKRVWSVFSNWFQQARPFVGHSRDLLHAPDDFLALKSESKRDGFSSVLEHITGFVIAGARGLAHKGDQDVLTYYSEGAVQNFVTLLSIVGATALFEVAIVALYLVKSDSARFGLIAAFVLLFAAAVSFLSNASRSEMFAATAAYAAVLVVFLSGNLQGSGA